MILEVFSSVDTMQVYVLIRNYIPNVIAYIFSLSETQIKSFISVLQDGVIESAKSVITKHWSISLLLTRWQSVWQCHFTLENACLSSVHQPIFFQESYILVYSLQMSLHFGRLQFIKKAIHTQHEHKIIKNTTRYSERSLSAVPTILKSSNLDGIFAEKFMINCFRNLICSNFIDLNRTCFHITVIM